MKSRTGMLVLCVCLIAGCDNAKDLPLLSRYVAKNFCASLWLEGYDESAAAFYSSNIASLIQPSWKTRVTGQYQVDVDNFWFPWLVTRSANLVAGEQYSDCRNDYGIPSLLPRYTLPDAPRSGLVSAVDMESALQGYVESVVAVGAPEYTTAVVVVKGDRVVAEAYRDGIDQQSPLKGFSMSKSFANLLVGRLVSRGEIQVNDPLLLPEWNDDRVDITWDSSLRMSSGLQWHEAALGRSNDQGQMLYNSVDPAGYAAAKALSVPPYTVFNYSSGDYMNISTALLQQPGWFDPGWNPGPGFALEFSPDGRYPLLAEGVYLSARGWAELASVYAHQGQLGGEQVLSPHWVSYSLSPSGTNYDYGAGIWLNLGRSLLPSLPSDAFAFIGSMDRYVVAIPSLDVIVVRIGFSAQPGDFDMDRFTANVLELVP